MQIDICLALKNLFFPQQRILDKSCISSKLSITKFSAKI